VAYDSVIVVLDGSKTAAEALPRALATALDNDASLLLLYVLTPRGGPEPGGAAVGGGGREHDLRRSQAEGYLQGMRRSLEESGVRVDARVEEGAVGGVAARAAAASQQPVVVMTGRPGFTPTQIDGHAAESDGDGSRSESIPVLIVEPRVGQR